MPRRGCLNTGSSTSKPGRSTCTETPPAMDTRDSHWPAPGKRFRCRPLPTSQSGSTTSCHDDCARDRLTPAPLAPNFVERERHGGREVERAKLEIEHRDRDGGGSVAGEDIIRQADALAPEYQHRRRRVRDLLKA